MLASGSLHGDLKRRLMCLVDDLPDELHKHPQGELAADALEAVVAISRSNADPVDWTILSSALADVCEALRVFHPHRHLLKVAVFGSSQITSDTPVYRQTVDLCRQIVAAGFEVMTGAGDGVMEAANCGAGPEHSFGLHVQLPFEFRPNPYIDSNNKLVTFRHFFTRKHFFLQESDAVVAMPGGFGTLDELFETLTLVQTAKIPPIPVVLLSPSGDDYWQRWEDYVHSSLEQNGMVPFADERIYVLMDSVDAAVAYIRRFYRVFHRCHLTGDQVRLLLHAVPSEQQLQALNRDFQHMLRRGRIESCNTTTAPGTTCPCLSFCLDCRYVGSLYTLINRINNWPLQGKP